MRRLHLQSCLLLYSWYHFQGNISNLCTGGKGRKEKSEKVEGYSESVVQCEKAYCIVVEEVLGYVRR